MSQPDDGEELPASPLFIALGRVLDDQLRLANLAEAYRRLVEGRAGDIEFVARCGIADIALPAHCLMPAARESLRALLTRAAFEQLCDEVLAQVDPFNTLVDAIISARSAAAGLAVDAASRGEDDA